MKKIILVAVLFFTVITFSQDNYHDTQGKLEISNSGQSIYTLPIALPPSIQDVGPTINLMYASGQIGGIAGQGWSINSISSISRISTRKDIDGVIDGVDFDNNDKLALDGQRLIIKTGTYWADGSTYETEFKSNNKIELIGSGVNMYFVVTNPDGSRAWYGNYGGMNAIDVTSYYITRFEDTNGNFVTYHYTKPFSKSMCIDEIKFSGNTIGINQQNRIKFHYDEQAKRTENFFINGIKHEKVELLNKIEVFTNAQLFRKYVIHHTTDSQLAYQKVSKIEEFNGSSEIANPIDFIYETTVSTNVGTEQYSTFTSNLNFNEVQLRGDFDGDGRLDFIDESRLFTNLFQSWAGGSFITIPTIAYDHRLTVTTLSNSNKLNQKNSVLHIKKLSNLQTEFKVYEMNGSNYTNAFTKTINLDLQVVGLPISTNSGGVASIQCLSHYQNSGGYNYPNSRGAGFSESDFDGNGISEILISLSPKTLRAFVEPFYPNQPYTFNPNDCPITLTEQSSREYYILDLDQNQSTDLGSSGFLLLQSTHLVANGNAAFHFNDFNGDGKTDIMQIIGNNYNIIEIIKTPNYAYTVLIGSGTIDALTADNSKPIMFGDFNGDNKVDLIIPNGNGSNAQKDDTLWHIYYSNPKPSGGTFFVKESHNIVQYWPNSGGHYETQVHLNGYYVMDTNKDGKSDLVRVWRRKFYTWPEINDYDNQYQVTSFVNNIGNTQIIGTKFPLDYSSQYNNVYTSPEMVSPLVSTYRNQGLTSDLVLLRNHDSKIYYINFTKDVSSDVLLKKVTSQGGGVTHEISYKTLEPDNQGVNGTGFLNEFYSSLDEVQFPYVELKRIPTTRLVSSLKHTVGGISKFQDFRYHGLIVHMNGMGSIGFKKTARSAWYVSPTEARIWSVDENNHLWRGSRQRSYTQLVTNGSAFAFTNSSNPAGIINSSINEFTTSTAINGVYTIILDKQTNTDYLTNIKNEITYLYSTPYLLQENVVSKKYLNLSTLQGTTTTIKEYENNPAGSGNSYYVGRIKRIETTNSAYNDTFKTEEKYTYSGNRLTKKETKANNTDNVYLTEDYEYFPIGNLKKKTLSAPGATPSVFSRVTEYTYDTSERFIKTIKDINGLITTYNSYHPLYGVVLSETNPFGQTTISVYDNWGKRTKITDYLNKSVNYVYTKTGGLYTTSQSGDDGSGSVIEMDLLGRVLRKGSKNINSQWIYQNFEYDFLNRQTKESEPYFGSSPSQWNVTKYDDYSRVVEQNIYTGLTNTITYSGLTVTTNDGVKTTSTTKNANGHMVSATDPGGTINYTYYAHGEMKSSTFDGVILSMEYDAWGRKTKLTDPSAGVYQYEYNAYGETTKEITPKGQTTYSYTPTGQLNSKSIQGDLTSQIIEYGYNAFKQLTVVDCTSAGNAFTTEYIYDSNKRLQTKLESNPESYFETSYEYDEFGRVNREFNKAVDLATGLASEKWIKNTYLLGFHHQILDGVTNEVLWDVDLVNERGQLLSAFYSNGIGKVSYTYDTYGMPLTSSYRTTIGAYSSPTPFLTLSTNFNAQRGLLNSRSNSMFNWNETFQYDSLERLTHYTNGSGQTEQQFYDNKGRITENSVGTYSYESSAKPYQTTKVGLTAAGISYYTDKPLQQITYNAFKSPVSISEQNKERIDFEYNGFQTRTTMYYGSLEKDKNLRPLRKHYSSDSRMEIKRDIYTNEVQFITYIGGDGYSAPLIVKGNGYTQNYFYLHRDYLGSILAVSNSAGLVVEKRHFDAWGNLVFLKDQNNNNLTNFVVLDRGYTGHEHLQGVGLIHMNGRLYDSKVHRFLSPDNFIQDPTNTQNFNRYGYVLNNPLKYSDPSGELIFVAIAIGAGVAMLTYTITAALTGSPFSAGGLLKSAAIGALSGAVTFGIGEAASSITQLGARIAFGTFFHGASQGIMAGLQGGDVTVGFASGALSSFASSLWGGGTMEKGGAWNGLGGKFGHSVAGTLAFGTLAGGAGASLAKGNFWQGAVTGLVVSGLNHLIHDLIEEKNTLTKDEIKRIREHYPESDKVSLDELIELIGGDFAKLAVPGSKLYNELSGNTCATRLSYAMNKAGFKVTGKNVYSGNGMKVFTSANNMTKEYLIPNFTRPNVWKDSKYDYPLRTNAGEYLPTSIIAQYDLAKGRYTHVDVIYNSSAGTNIYNSSHNLNFYGL